MKKFLNISSISKEDFVKIEKDEKILIEEGIDVNNTLEILRLFAILEEGVSIYTPEDDYLTIEKSQLGNNLVFSSEKDGIRAKIFMTMEKNKSSDSKFDNFLYPRGTVVKITGIDEKIMIENLVVFAEGETMYNDYTGNIIPNNLENGQKLVFNHENIEEVLYIGYQDEEIIQNAYEIKKRLEEKEINKRIM